MHFLLQITPLCYPPPTTNCSSPDKPEKREGKRENSSEFSWCVWKCNIPNTIKPQSGSRKVLKCACQTTDHMRRRHLPGDPSFKGCPDGSEDRAPARPSLSRPSLTSETRCPWPRMEPWAISVLFVVGRTMRLEGS